MNQTLEQYLWCYINYLQDDWIQFLSLIQFVYNNAINESTKKTLMYTNYSYTSIIYGEAREAKDVSIATKMAKQLKQLHEELKTDLQFI